jgi:uncharacterized protein YkwD
MLCVFLAVGGLLAFALPRSSSASTSPSKPALASSLAGIQQSIRECANRNRVASGLEPLMASSVLTDAARLHAKNMSRLGFFDHTDPQGRGPSERVQVFDSEARFEFVGENIAAGYNSVRQACVGWMHSAGHRANILGRGYTHVGGGYATGGPFGRYYVQVFAKLTEGEAPFVLLEN